MPPDPPLSPAARDLRHEIARLDRQYQAEHGRAASGPELARLLHARYVVPKRKRWWQR